MVISEVMEIYEGMFQFNVRVAFGQARGTSSPINRAHRLGQDRGCCWANWVEVAAAGFCFTNYIFFYAWRNSPLLYFEYKFLAVFLKVNALTSFCWTFLYFYFFAHRPESETLIENVCVLQTPLLVYNLCIFARQTTKQEPLRRANNTALKE